MKMLYQKKIAAVVSIPLLLLLTGCPPNKLIPMTASHGVQLYAQETERWCWAASAEMCMKFLGVTTITQCDQANKQFGRSDCCKSIVPTDCINGSFPEFEKYNFTYSRTRKEALSWVDIKKQIYNLKKPIAFSWEHNGGGGHMMVITGYDTIDGINWLFVNDPLEVHYGSQYSITYSEYVSSPDHSHWDDFYNITKK